jgi:dTDP-4-amino-4,6-dideoxygalactose transaminase
VSELATPPWSTGTKLPIARPTLPSFERYSELIADIWQSRMLSNFSTYARRLEALAAEQLGSRHVLAIVSADVGLMAVLRALDLPASSPCYVADFTFNSTINAALWNALRPVIVDIDPKTLNIDPKALERAMARHGGPGVVLATHAFGNPCPVSAIETAARVHGCFLVFDAAHAYGSLREGTPVGRFGDAEVFSLSGTKLVTSGEGGLISTDHNWLADRLKLIRGYGFVDDYESKWVGINGKMSELHAALGLLNLADVDRVVERRVQNYATYRQRLGSRVGWQLIRPSDRSTHKDIAIRVGAQRADVARALAEAGVETKRYFMPLHVMKPYERFAEGELVNTSTAYETLLCVPSFSELTDSDIGRVAKIILRALGEESPKY